MSFIASSNLWGDQACARLCEIIVDANDGMAQQIMENRHDLLDLLTAEQLQDTDDLGLSLPYLAVYYDRPDMLKYLRRRGFDLSQPCDPMNFGNTMFYAVSLGKVDLIPVLNSLGVSINDKCETFSSQAPLYYAKRAANTYLIKTIQSLQERDSRAKLLLLKNVLRIKYRNLYRKAYRCVGVLQRFGRWIILCRSRIHQSRRKLSDASGTQSIRSMTTIHSGSSQTGSVSKGGESTATTRKQSTTSGGKGPAGSITSSTSNLKHAAVAGDDRSHLSNSSNNNSRNSVKGLRGRALSNDSVGPNPAPQKPHPSRSTSSQARAAVQPSFDDSDEENDTRPKTQERASVRKSKNDDQEGRSEGTESASKGNLDGQPHSTHSIDSSRSDEST